MNEIQGPTPAGTSKPYRSLTEALRAHRIDPMNHAFIEAIVAAVGVTSLIDRGRYIEAIRRGEGAALHIGRSYTNGFAEDERVVVGSVAPPLLPSEGRPPYFYVDHPSQHPAASRHRPPVRREQTPRAPKTPDRDYGVCEVCFMMRTASGACGCD